MALFPHWFDNKKYEGVSPCFVSVYALIVQTQFAFNSSHLHDHATKYLCNHNLHKLFICVGAALQEATLQKKKSISFSSIITYQSLARQEASSKLSPPPPLLQFQVKMLTHSAHLHTTPHLSYLGTEAGR